MESDQQSFHRNLSRRIQKSLETVGSNSAGKMVYILGVSFPERQLVSKSLLSFFGVGPSVCARLMARHNVHPTARIGDLANKQVLDITSALSNMKIENDLRREILDNIRRLKDTGTYRGRRHALNLPVRGQRTRTQTKTAIKLNAIERRL
ncbi:hypothetical protein D8B26_007927 [Coccidioides posadasii str. Silveira]|nr:putative mitochondrial 37S ribosomal protein SWS2 [Coccidioides posadasii C735 delta SOWgp]EER25301.1 mitochondrial 37S ribosomal protein SWS2, putative [Coccidioides posadasii C735 delta SOWgp]KMM72191.1 30S ribosomal protein S13 [Coccidioides posadasii RMSCC 3488]QVM13317.1 hypothetical protein D8B26_007927 [Coccidioides posadasii str. Silveira]TPX20987.1 hypothetical protein DIZ76_016884 [Coccidioides immitis]|eukprot:XP_003067446.1 putative mitochondrial 37S ribosomal protein SWS2 [Coccidioides posadasii C735 delta SOWgp]